MLCKIADLFVEVPEAGGIAPRCQAYLHNGNAEPDIVILEDRYEGLLETKHLNPESRAYMESGRQFCVQLLEHDGFYLHSSAVAVDGKAYLFSADSGVGKSTHTRLWQQILGDKAQVFNDDKPALRFIDDRWYAYGTPWCGKDGININMKVPLAGVCFLKRGKRNAIRQLDTKEALIHLLPQTIYRFGKPERLDLLLSHVNRFLEKVPVFELENLPVPEAAYLSYETMRRKAEEK